MPPKTSAATMAAATMPTHFGTKIPAGRSVDATGAAGTTGATGATGAVGSAAAAAGATGAATVGASDTSSSSPADFTASSYVNGLSSTVGGSWGAAGTSLGASALGASGSDGVGDPSASGVSLLMIRILPGSTLPPHGGVDRLRGP